MSIEWVRKYYGVPAKRGGRIEYTGAMTCAPALGTITSARNGRIYIRLDGRGPRSLPFHPTWQLRYLDEAPRAA